MDRAALVGVYRDDEAKREGRTPRHDPDKTRSAHIVGAQAELAFCRMLGFDWPARTRQWETGKPDVDPLWEVRYGQNPRKLKVLPAPDLTKTGRARYRYTDNVDLIAVHISGRPPQFDIIGFINVSWVQQHEPLVKLGADDESYAHWVSATKLSPIDPGFHALCAWAKDAPGLPGWNCLFCGAPFEEGLDG